MKWENPAGRTPVCYRQGRDVRILGVKKRNYKFLCEAAAAGCLPIVQYVIKEAEHDGKLENELMRGFQEQTALADTQIARFNGLCVDKIDRADATGIAPCFHVLCEVCCSKV